MASSSSASSSTSPSTQSTTDLAEQHFHECFKKFEARLSAQERQDFKFTSLDDLRRTILHIQAKQAAKSQALNLARLRRFLEVFEQFGQVVEVFLNTSQFVAFVWGPMKFLLLVASNFADAFDTLLSAYEHLGESIPLIDQYRTIFPDNKHMKEALSKIYEDILEFHRRALRFFTLPTWRQFFKSVWKDFDHRFKNILQDLRQHKALIESQATILHFQQYQTDRVRLLNEIERQEMAERKKQFTEIIEWMSPANSLQDHEDICNVRYEFVNSGAWLLRNSVYSSWKEDSIPKYPTLWINGIPGAGKTVLASLAIENCQKDNEAKTAYFYCKHDDPYRTTQIGVLKGILCQILTHDHDLIPWMYEQYLTSGQLTLSSVELSKKLFEVVLLNSKKVHLVIDGLDECEASQRKALLLTLSRTIDLCEIQCPGKLRALIVSQDEIDIRRNMPPFSEIQIQPADNQSDIYNFVQVWCDRIQEKFELPDEDSDYIREITSHRAEGMFLFVKLVMKNLYDQINVENLKAQIQPNVFPAGLGQAYARIVDRIKQRPNSEQSLAVTILGWMICARRPLRWREMQGASCIDIEENDIRVTERQSRVHIREICGSLVTQLSGDRLELVHKTAKHYLADTDFVQAAVVEFRLTILCLKYLTLECFDSDLTEEARKIFVMNGSLAFMDYAAVHWADHLTYIFKNDSGTFPLYCNQIKPHLSSALADFIAQYQIAGREDEERDTEPASSSFFSDPHLYTDLRHITDHIERQKLRGVTELDNVDPELLSTAISAYRKLLEIVASSSTIDAAQKSNLTLLYGANVYKCSRATCFYFHEGFPNEQARQAHMLRHEKPFRCPLQECESGYRLGFTSKRELDKHTLLHHPELNPSGTSFSRLRKAKPKQETSSGSHHGNKTKHAAIHACTLCSKRFTRASILRSHLLAHQNVKNFTCGVCKQRFVRDNDRKRHEITHTGVRKYICTVICTNPPKDHGCGKEFPRADALANHWYKGLGKACFAPLIKEQGLQKQRELFLEEMKTNGSDVPVSEALQDLYFSLVFQDWQDMLQAGEQVEESALGSSNMKPLLDSRTSESSAIAE